MGKSGAGHFVKMVHNGIEYGMMQAIAEGFAVMKASSLDLNLLKVAEIYNHRSVIESRLIGWLKKAFQQYGENLQDISGSVAHTGEGSWTVEAARELGVPAPIIEGALAFRIESQTKPIYTGQILSALRNQFGRHDVFRK
jgi:6-phosphogluconate dehydrogenase